MFFLLNKTNYATINILHLSLHFGFYFHRKIPQIGISGSNGTHTIFLLTVGLPSSSLPPFVLLSTLPPHFFRGACVCRQESPAVRTHPCQVWIISARWGAGSAVSWLHCVSIASGWPDCLQFPLFIYSMLRNYPWSSSVAGAAQSVGREALSERKGRYSAFSQCQICYVFMSFP